MAVMVERRRSGRGGAITPDSLSPGEEGKEEDVLEGEESGEGDEPGAEFAKGGLIVLAVLDDESGAEFSDRGEEAGAGGFVVFAEVGAEAIGETVGRAFAFGEVAAERVDDIGDAVEQLREGNQLRGHMRSLSAGGSGF